jgi:hypothetical protein
LHGFAEKHNYVQKNDFTRCKDLPKKQKICWKSEFNQVLKIIFLANREEGCKNNKGEIPGREERNDIV